ncbi:hypothetical protein [Massilia sp. TSP1-1-2]|uniref:hypothetical protein n=1 Tax=Massilia sp. TSP1-1-2 TaxID=2804649 RepID=UPI003CF55D0B
MDCHYVQQHYGVPAQIGRRVVVGGKPGVIAADRGNYIGVNFDDHKPGHIENAHPTSDVVYGEMGRVRKPSRGRARYQRYLEYGDGFDNFVDFCYWDADPERSWNH